MMHKERLEEIKKELELDWSDISYVVNQDDVKWLINRVEELEEQVKDLKIMLKVLGRQTERYKQALEFYADEEHYKEKLISEAQYDADGICISNDEYDPPIIYFDSGEKARQALEGTK